MCIIASPEGIEKMHEVHPDVDVFVGALDDHLNEHGYIKIGLDAETVSSVRNRRKQSTLKHRGNGYER